MIINKIKQRDVNGNIKEAEFGVRADHVKENTTHRFVTDAEKAIWNGKAAHELATTQKDGLMGKSDKVKLNGIAQNANNFVHPTTAGSKHIPSGGTTGSFLAYGGSSGTARWENVDLYSSCNKIWWEGDKSTEFSFYAPVNIPVDTSGNFFLMINGYYEDLTNNLTGQYLERKNGAILMGIRGIGTFPYSVSTYLNEINYSPWNEIEISVYSNRIIITPDIKASVHVNSYRYHVTKVVYIRCTI